eukprot:COSAG02_NODE_18563_length_932_cov_0.885954_2_plen_78_part_01
MAAAARSWATERRVAIGALSAGATAAALWSLSKKDSGTGTAPAAGEASPAASVTAAALEPAEGWQIEHRMRCGAGETG